MDLMTMGHLLKYRRAAMIFIAALTFPVASAADISASHCKDGEPCLSWADGSPQSSSPPQMTDIQGTSLEWSRVSNRTLPGLGPNERLCPTDCPVGVMTPEGSEILDCYKICTPVDGRFALQAQPRVSTASRPTSQVSRPVTSGHGTYAVSSVTIPVHRHHPIIQTALAPPVILHHPVHTNIFYAQPPLIVPAPMVLRAPMVVSGGCTVVYC